MIGKSEEDRKAYQNITLKNHEMVSRIEAEAFYDGYYLAPGLANSSCKTVFAGTSSALR